MRIQNNLDSIIIVNIRKRHGILRFDSDDNFRLDGTAIPARGSVWMNADSADVIFVSNISKTYSEYLYLSSVEDININEATINVWNSVSDILRCQQLGKSQGVSCSDSVNLLLQPRLHNLLIFKLYSGFSYFLFVIIISIVIAVAIIVGLFLL
jgi:hypothetical protein